MKMLARFSVQKALFRFADAAPPIAEPTAVPAINGRSRMPDATASFKLTICARRGMLTMTRSMTNPVRMVLLLRARQWGAI